MRFKWIVLLLLLVLPVMIADIDASSGNENSLDTVKERVPLRSHRFKRQCGCSKGPGVIVVCCKGGAGQKEMFRNWWLHVS
ncbi:unnamed protein product [Onchocerca flexuosa]|uniref:WAP domain-containing protein n=1 Tax=Onchocerca flexuosa TaxID=387005 RepID=A0A183HU67_9BILA|nr:unnamed protein product [Onchocerca flexuosa]